MSAVAFTVAAVSAVLGDTEIYKVVPTRSGVQVNLNLSNVPSDAQKIDALNVACEKLKAAGYPIDRDRDLKIARPPMNKGDSWTSWPCVFVNRPTAQVAAGIDATQLATIVATTVAQVMAAQKAADTAGASVDPAAIAAAVAAQTQPEVVAEVEAEEVGDVAI